MSRRPSRISIPESAITAANPPGDPGLSTNHESSHETPFHDVA